MRVFDHPNFTKFECPICKTADDKPVVLIAMAGTQDGHNVEAKQFHLDCIDLWYFKDRGIIAQIFETVEKEKKPECPVCHGDKAWKAVCTNSKCENYAG